MLSLLSSNAEEFDEVNPRKGDYGGGGNSTECLKQNLTLGTKFEWTGTSKESKLDLSPEEDILPI